MVNFQQAFAYPTKGPPLKKRKNPGIAFVVGFFFGPVGLGIYFESWPDFLLPLAIIILTAFGTLGLAAPVAWMFCGAWGAVRASTSNKHHDGNDKIHRKQLDSVITVSSVNVNDRAAQLRPPLAVIHTGVVSCRQQS
jgi:hypothetical protein